MSDRKWSAAGEIEMTDYTTKICLLNGVPDNKVIRLTNLLNTPNFFFVRAVSSNANDNAYQLQDAYNRAKQIASVPSNNISATNRITVVVAPGKYDFSIMPTFGPRFIVDTQYIDIVSLTGNRDVILNQIEISGKLINSIYVPANDVFIKGISTRLSSFLVASNLNLLKLENCEGGEESFCGEARTFSGYAINCIGGNSSFGGVEGYFSGKAINCIAGSDSFGATNLTSSGIVTNCTAGIGSFGSGVGTNVYGFYGTANNCVGGSLSFGGNGVFGSTGKAYYCRLTSGAFNVPLIGGKQILCIDGNNNVITR